jgi:hypothetical protein
MSLAPAQFTAAGGLEFSREWKEGLTRAGARHGEEVGGCEIEGCEGWEAESKENFAYILID